MRIFLFYLIFWVILPVSSFSQIWPAENAVLNYRVIGFTFPSVNHSSGFTIEIAHGAINNEDSFQNHVFATVEGDGKEAFGEVPAFGSRYSWRVKFNQNAKTTIKSPIHHFSTGTSTFLDTNKFKVEVSHPAEKYKRGYVFIDPLRALFDMDGQPVWYLPALDGVVRENANVRDLKSTGKGTITFLLEGDCYEINYNGDILWKGPGGRKTKGDTMQAFHHELTRLDNGHFMTLGYEPIDRRAIHGNRDTLRHRTRIDTSSLRKPREHYRSPRYGTLLEFDEHGKIVWKWEASSYFESANLDAYKKTNGMPEFDIHENSFYFDEKNSTIYISFRNISQILKISYPSGIVLKAYGSIEVSRAESGNGLFCGQHACKLTSNGDLILFDNGCSFSTPPKVAILKEPRSAKDNIEIKWEYPCPVALLGVDMPARRMQLSTGGNAIELPDHSLFVSTCSPYSKLFIVTMEKQLLWTAEIKHRNPSRNEWLSLPVYRASIMPERKDLETLISKASVK